MIRSSDYMAPDERAALTALVQQSSRELLERVLGLQEEGRQGWGDDSDQTLPQVLAERLLNNINEGDWVDVMACAMFLYNLSCASPVAVLDVAWSGGPRTQFRAI